MAFYKNGLVAFAGAGFNIVGATNIEVSSGIKEVEGMGAGQISPSMVAILTAEPHISLTIQDIGTLVANGIAAAAVPIGSAQTITSVTVYGVQGQDDGDIALDSGNSDQLGISFTVSKGMITLDSIQGRQGAVATAKVTIHAESSDGTTNPIATAVGQDLPAVAALTQLYTVGPVEINNSTIATVTGIDYNGGIKVTNKSSNGAVFSTFNTVTEWKPKLSITSYDASLYNTYTGLGTALGASSFVAYFMELANKGTRVANNTGTHIKIAGSASQGMIWPERVSLQAADGEATLHICPIVGTAVVLAISQAAIT